MVTCKPGEKTYHIDFISGRRQAEHCRGDGHHDPLVLPVFGNPFTPDEPLDGYPVDRLMHDIALTLMAVQTQTTGI